MRSRFVQVEREYFFPDGTPAFRDHGNRLTTRSENSELVRSLVEIAQMRGWQAVQVAGTARFRQLAWQAGMQAGLQVQGFRASPVLQAREARVTEPTRRRETPSAERAAVVEPSPAGEASSVPEERRDIAPLIRGELLDHGRANYQFHPQEQSSYYVKLRTTQGERVIWGSDLERALRESTTHPRLGDFIGLQPERRESVTVSASVRDADGEVLGQRNKAAHRNHWSVERLEVFENRQGAAQTLRDVSVSAATGVERHPELKDAYLHVRAAQLFASEKIGQEADRRRFVQLVRSALATAVARGDEIAPARLHQRRAHEAGTARAPDYELAR